LPDVGEWGKVVAVEPVSKAIQLFPRIEKNREGKTVKKKIENTEGKISFQEFQKMDLRVGTIKTVEAIPGSKKLLKLTVDIGEERTVVTGISDYYDEGTLVGKQVVLVANLEPIRLMGVESMGMVLAAEDSSGVHLLVPDVQTVPGSRIK